MNAYLAAARYEPIEIGFGPQRAMPPHGWEKGAKCARFGVVQWEEVASRVDASDKLAPIRPLPLRGHSPMSARGAGPTI